MTRAVTVRLAVSAGAILLLAVQTKAAQSPFGIATPDGSGGGFGGPLAPIFGWIAIQQSQFYRALTGALGSLRQDAAGVWLLFGLSFAYGVFHAAGPGHGKAVITSYILASGELAKRGIALSFASALVQALSAIIIVAIGAMILRVSATSMTSATDTIEIVSYGAIALFGAWLLWSKIRGHHHHHRHVASADSAHDHDHKHGNNDDQCDHRHAHNQSPAAAKSRPLLARAWTAVLAVGIRPCTGAIIVLVFALSQGLLAAGVAATFVMALGTGLTVAVLATLAVSAKGLALRLAGSGRSVALLGRGIEIAGAAAVLLLGLLLLGGALQAGMPG